jgi:oligopeptide transport system substrate-binding protein
MDPDQYDINEAANWDPKTETLTLTIEGKEYTMTYQAWSNSMIGNGEFASASNAVKLQITAMLEQDYLEKYYRIPLCGSTVCSMLSFQVQYYTEEYNIMYGFGGMRLMTYKYDDAQWAKLVKENNGQLDYT